MSKNLGNGVGDGVPEQADSDTSSDTSSDPRVKRTRRRLHEALLALSIERGYDAVTVQDVLVRAETARSTFYAHFRDKDDLLLAGFRDRGEPLFSALFDAGDGADPFIGFTRHLFAHIDQNKAFAKAILGTSSAALVIGHLRNIIVIEARRLVGARRAAQGGVLDELSVQFVASTAFNLLTWWIDHDFPLGVDEMSAVCHRFIATGLGRPGEA